MSRIIIIDDQATNRRVLAQLAASFEENGWIETFENPVDALEWCRHTIPDLVVTDFNMPQMSGADFIRKFRELDGCRDIPVMVVTAYEDAEFRYKGLEAGATDFLLSPVDHREFVTRARNLLHLRASVRQKERLAALGSAMAKIHHDMRNILTSARLLSDYITLSGDETVQKVAPTLVRAVDRAVHLTSQTMDFLRGDTGAPKPQRFLLQALIDDVFDAMRGGDSRIVFEAYIPEDLAITADRVHLERALINLVRNALQAGAGRIEISAHTIDDSLILEVADDGPGLPPDRMRDLFGPMGKSTNPGGLGLGLAIANELIQAHGGKIQLVASAPGKGTRFRIDMPVTLSEEEAEQAPATAPA